ncbi:MAG: hypothetical protein ACI4I1_01275 [Oscillospiraceae bacterium]
MKLSTVDQIIELYWQKESEFTEFDCGILIGFFKSACESKENERRSHPTASTPHRQITMTKCAK